MGKGINLARDEAPEHAAMLDDFKDQLLMVCMKRLADADGKISISLKEMDDTGMDLLSFSVNNKIFNFKLTKKT